MSEDIGLSIKTPSTLDNIYKDECCFSFDGPESKDGLFVCLNTFLGFGKQFVTLYHNITGFRLFLNIKVIKKPIESPEDAGQSPMGKKPKRLAIGVEGGFTPEDNFVREELYSVVVLPDFMEMSLEDAKLAFPSLEKSVTTILSRESAAKTDTIAWDGEVRPVSKHAENLKQLDNGVKIGPTGWKCRDCDLTTNLWLNLTDGTILCGRRYFDGTGGNNHGIEYFQKTGYPLAVKLGTITPSGADVHSYDEDTMVEDPWLSKHLAHFGINMMQMEKTEQTMTEMEIELNEKVGSEWDLIQEAGKKLKVLCGPGLTGLQNMGNTCYMNSVMQVLHSIPEFEEKYSDRDRCLTLFQNHIEGLNVRCGTPCKNENQRRQRIQDMMGDFTLQMCKVGYALQEHDKEKSDDKIEDDAENDEANNKPRPRVLKRIIGKGHSEFSTNRQQDAHEYLLHLFSVIEKNQHISGTNNPTDCFKFMIEERLECQQSGFVRYTKRPEYALSLPVSVGDAINPEAVREYEELKELNKRDVSVKLGEIVRAQIPFNNCLQHWLTDEVVTGFWSSATKEKGDAKTRMRFASFPNYLVIHLKKFTADENWIPRKLDVRVLMPDEIDLSSYRGEGMQKTETALPEGEAPASSKPEVQINEEDIVMLTSMGFAADRSREALVATGGRGVEVAMNWLFENPESKSEPAEPQISEDSIDSLMSMGFSHQQATKALTETSGDVGRAVDWLFSHADDLMSSAAANSDDNAKGESSSASNGNVIDGPGKYELMSFVSHMGASTMCGHYVCHIKKENRWVIYNDEKVAESVDPPKDLGYIYFYKRVSN